MPVNLIVGTNSYIDLTYADNYFTERLFSDTWTNADNDTKTKAILMATKKIERQPIRGRKVKPDQAMQFPRMFYSYEKCYLGMSKDNPIGINNYGPGWYAETEASDNVKQAVCEEALAILQLGNSKRISLQKQGVKSFNIGGMSETLKGNTITFLSQEAKELLKNYISGGIEIL